MGTTGRSLITAVTAFADAPGPHDQAATTELQVGRVEEDHLSEFRFERVEIERRDRRVLIRVWHRQLELDAVGVLE